MGRNKPGVAPRTRKVAWGTLAGQRHAAEDGGDAADKAGGEIKHGDKIMPRLPALHDVKREGGKGGEAAAEAGDAKGAQGGVVAGKRLREVADEQAADEVRQPCAKREGAGRATPSR